ncbi:hypothetical protein [Carnobacterium maltaromaticum]|uniref:hypothetical protein n=1 Tax=Carnobacterium maltaromaticum TaxID=2751 RepID=UPI0039BDDA44
MNAESGSVSKTLNLTSKETGIVSPRKELNNPGGENGCCAGCVGCIGNVSCTNKGK